MVKTTDIQRKANIAIWKEVLAQPKQICVNSYSIEKVRDLIFKGKYTKNFSKYYFIAKLGNDYVKFKLKDLKKSNTLHDVTLAALHELVCDDRYKTMDFNTFLKNRAYKKMLKNFKKGVKEDEINEIERL